MLELVRTSRASHPVEPDAWLSGPTRTVCSTREISNPRSIIVRITGRIDYHATADRASKHPCRSIDRAGGRMAESTAM
jgi:hypothetical protein